MANTWSGGPHLEAPFGGGVRPANRSNRATPDPVVVTTNYA